MRHTTVVPLSIEVHFFTFLHLDHQHFMIQNYEWSPFLVHFFIIRRRKSIEVQLRKNLKLTAIIYRCQVVERSSKWSKYLAADSKQFLLSI